LHSPVCWAFAMVRSAIAIHPYHGSKLDPNSISLQAGESVLVAALSSDGHWASVQVHDGRRGWVALPCLEVGSEVETPKSHMAMSETTLAESPVSEAPSEADEAGSPPRGPSFTVMVHPDNHSDVHQQIAAHIEAGPQKPGSCWQGCFAGLERGAKYSAGVAAIAAGLALVIHSPA